MTKSRTLLAAAFATLALGAGTAFAGSEQCPSGPALLTYSAEVVAASAWSPAPCRPEAPRS